MKHIKIKGARAHNLKNINLSLPRDKFIVITGLSGSGKSSLAFDTLYAEGQRRYVESLSAYARQFLSLMAKPDVDHIEGLSPAIAIEQKSTSHNPRSTVGTVTEIYDYLRLLFARIGEPVCIKHNTILAAQTISQMVDKVLMLPKETKVMLLAPIVRNRKGEHNKTLANLAAQGFIRARIDGEIQDLSDPPKLELHQKHTIEAVVDRFKVRMELRQRLAESLETTLDLSGGIAIAAPIQGAGEELLFSANFACPTCGYSISELEPRLFSFNNPAGACSYCDGLGVQQYFDPNKVIINDNLSLAGGAIRGWGRRNYYYFQMLTSLANHYQFDIEQPFSLLSSEHKNYILQGSDGVEILFSYADDKGGVRQRRHHFEGILPNMERRYRETESNAVREDLAKYISVKSCVHCGGSRLCEAACNVFIGNYNLPKVTNQSIAQLVNCFQQLTLSGKKAKIAEQILKEIQQRLGFLVNVGLDYLTLDRSAETLSGGEAQRIRLASQIGAGLVGVMYVLDEPSIGLHQRDNKRLLATLTYLRDLGNTVIVVEHDEEAIRAADYVIDIGPGAGVHGGEIIAEGQLQTVIENTKSLTGDYLSGRKSIAIPKKRQAPKEHWLNILGASGNNLKQVDLKLPIGLITCVTGVSGSGKSTLINDTLFPIVQCLLNGATTSKPAPYKDIQGTEYLDKVVDINQSPIGRTPRSNPATYTGIFTTIRELFAGTQEARARGYKLGRFSFNVKGGRCEICRGDGVIKVEMHFLPDIYVTCDQCKGKRYNRETLEVVYKNKNIHQILAMTVEEACTFFAMIPAIDRKLQTLTEVGLGYICLGQSAITLSGGEAQRVKLAKELAKRDTGKTLYILDEPTTGLHFHDVQHLLQILHKLRDNGNTVVIIEHNLDVIKTADWIIDLGPEGGDGGGQILAEGAPETVCMSKQSVTASCLKSALQAK